MTPELPQNKEKRLRDFREAIRVMIARSRENVQEGYGVGGHFSDLFNAEDLDEKDMDLFTKFKAGQLQIDELQREAITLKGSNNGSKKELMSYVINRIQQDLLDRS